VKRPTGVVSEEHYELQTAPISQPSEGEILVRSIYISVDPYMRIQQSALNTWEEPHPLNEVQGAGVVGEVIESKDERIKKGDFVACYNGWQTHGVCKASSARVLDPSVAPLSTALGVLGMPGRTAYFGLLDAGKPKEGETVVVSGAAGAVGSLVVQIAKIKGCRVVVIAGSTQKLEILSNEFGADAVINYKEHPTTSQMLDALKKACPNGIDVYFDNVGGHITDAVIELTNTFARIVICGQVSQYSGGLDEPEVGPRFLHKVLYKRLTIQGILARDYTPRNEEMIKQMSEWIKNGKLHYKETIEQGFESLPKALNSLFQGANIGKLLVKVDGQTA